LLLAGPTDESSLKTSGTHLRGMLEVASVLLWKGTIGPEIPFDLAVFRGRRPPEPIRYL
jgi:hypothetical protein